MAAARADDIYWKLKEIEDYLERRKAVADMNFKNRENDFINILNHFQEIIERLPQGCLGHILIKDSDTILPKKSQKITRGLLSNRYLNLRQSLQDLVKNAARDVVKQNFHAYICEIMAASQNTEDDSIKKAIYLKIERSSLPDPKTFYRMTTTPSERSPEKNLVL